HVFKLINPLDHDVVVVESATSCQCTGVDIKGKTIPARSSIDMPVSMKMSKAPIKKMAYVAMIVDLQDNGKKQPLRVEIHAEVAYSIRAVPPFIDALAPERMKGTFGLEARDAKPFRVLEVHGRPPAFVGFDPAKDAPRTKYTLNYDFTEPGFKIPHYLLIESDREDCPIVDVRVRHDSVRISPPFKVSEFRSNFGRIASDQTGTFDLEIEDAQGRKVTGVRSLSPLIEATLISQKEDAK